MPAPEKSAKWNSLLESLGVQPTESPAKAEVTPTTSSDAPDPNAPPPSRPQPAAMLPPAKAKPAPKPKPGPPAAKSPSYWSRIAGALGLEGAAPPEPEPEPAPEPVQRKAPERRPAEQPRVAPPAARETPPSIWDKPREKEPQVQPGSDAPSRSPLDDMIAPRTFDTSGFQSSERDDAPRVREPGTPRSRDLGEGGSVLEFDRDDNSDLPLGSREGRDEAGAARSEDAEGDGFRRRRRRRGRRGRGDDSRGQGDEPRSRGVEPRGRTDERGPTPPPHDEDIEPSGEEMDLNLDYEREEDVTADSPKEFGRLEERPRRDEPAPYAPRHPRDDEEGRGSRGRGRGRGGRGRDRDPASEERPSGYGRRSEVEPRESRSVPPPRPSEYQEELDDSDRPDLHAEHDEDDSEHGLGVSHKKIPTWEEAVNVLIDANMAQRAANPDRPRGGGRGRGRGRGR